MWGGGRRNEGEKCTCFVVPVWWGRLFHFNSRLEILSLCRLVAWVVYWQRDWQCVEGVILIGLVVACFVWLEERCFGNVCRRLWNGCDSISFCLNSFRLNCSLFDVVSHSDSLEFHDNLCVLASHCCYSYLGIWPFVKIKLCFFEYLILLFYSEISFNLIHCHFNKMTFRYSTFFVCIIICIFIVSLFRN